MFNPNPDPNPDSYSNNISSDEDDINIQISLDLKTNTNNKNSDNIKNNSNNVNSSVPDHNTNHTHNLIAQETFRLGDERINPLCLLFLRERAIPGWPHMIDLGESHINQQITHIPRPTPIPRPTHIARPMVSLSREMSSVQTTHDQEQYIMSRGGYACPHAITPSAPLPAPGAIP